MTKSVTSVLAGIAVADEALAVDDAAATWIDEWKRTTAEAVTVRDLLSNDSGRAWSFQSDYQGLLGAEDRTAYAVGLEQSEIGRAHARTAVTTANHVCRLMHE